MLNKNLGRVVQSLIKLSWVEVKFDSKFDFSEQGLEEHNNTLTQRKYYHQKLRGNQESVLNILKRLKLRVFVRIGSFSSLY